MKDIKNTIPDKLDPRVVTVALIVGVIEFEVFTFGKGIVGIAGPDAWLSVILGGIIVSLTTLLMIKLATRFPTKNLFDINKDVWGKHVAFLILIIYLVYWFIYLILLFEDTNFANKFLFLRRTPSLIPMIILAAGAAWLALYGMTSVIRFFQISFPFMIIPLSIIIMLSAVKVNFDNFLPVLSNGVMPVLKGALYYAGAIQGLELILFISPFLTDVKKSAKSALAGVGVIWLITIFEVFSTVGLLGVETVKSFSIFPGFSAITYIELPGFPVERFELFLTIPWIIGVFTTICLFVYLLSYGIMQLFGLKNKKAVCFLVSLLIIFATYMFPNFTLEEKVRNYFNIPTLVFVYLLPVLTLIVAAIRSKRDYEND